MVKIQEVLKLEKKKGKLVYNNKKVVKIGNFQLFDSINDKWEQKIIQILKKKYKKKKKQKGTDTVKIRYIQPKVSI